MSSQLLIPLTFPLHGSRLIEASAGTGKTWTIAALYVRLVLGHGEGDGFGRPLQPADILVMTFTRAATRELSNRVRERLLEAAAFFRGQSASDDPYLQALLAAYPELAAQQQAAHRLMLAAETMDEAAILTIDAWCQRMLREHAFDSGSLFDEELLNDEQTLFDDAANDYWRQQVYPLREAQLLPLLACWADVSVLKKSVRELVKRAVSLTSAPETLSALIVRVQAEQGAELAQLKEGWVERADQMEQWIGAQRTATPKCFSGVKMKSESVIKWFAALRAWALDPAALQPEMNHTAWGRLTPDGITDAYSKGYGGVVPDCFNLTAALGEALAAFTPLAHTLHFHAAGAIAGRMDELKRRARQFGFDDLTARLQNALLGPNGAALRQRIVDQYPLAMVDEFQDTAPGQYQILDLLYRVGANERDHGLLLIGDPKQSIYGFRGADIHSYLAAREATAGRHYQLGTNYRSTTALVGAVNQLFLHAEGAGFARGAFRFRDGQFNPLPFVAVAAQGRSEHLVSGAGPVQALTVACSAVSDLKADGYRDFFAQHCAEHIVGLLNDPQAGFTGPQGWLRLQPADIAVLVRDRREAAAIRQALQRRGVASVYLSDKDSVFNSEEAQDVLRWLQALANPLDGALARAAFATATVGLELAELAQLVQDELAWELRIEQLRDMHLVWQRQGVLAMLRRFIHALKLPAMLLQKTGGERRLTNLLHLAELLQTASRQLDGEQALIRWLAEQIAGGEAGDERVLRLESDAELVKVVTVHKSKGLEYPLVYLPFAVSARKVTRRNRSFFEFTDDAGVRQLDLALTDASLAAVEAARIEEDLRLLYVALTRARHFLWLGVTALAGKKAGDNTLHESALGYLLTGGERLPASELAARWQQVCGDCDTIAIGTLAPPHAETPLARMEQQVALNDAAPFAGQFERDWAVGSFTSLTRQVNAVRVAVAQQGQQETLLEDEDSSSSSRSDDAPWHRFPRGSVPGNFLHEQLEWIGNQGFASVNEEHFAARLGARCERAGWGHRQQDTVDWLRTVVSTTLPMVGASLCALDSVLPEMEFWFPSERLSTLALDHLCSHHLLGDVARPALPKRALHGMLKGFADLVFEHEGRYWVLDYKSNALGAGDAAYHTAALAAAMAQHRYDIQGALYMLALHRLLRSRLGASYDPQRQLGGALFLFLRGIANPHTHGCYWLAPELALLDGLDTLFNDAAALPPAHDD